MLEHLFISNFALIEELEISFTKGLNIITGETGAGKSIIIDALMLILGGRASADLVREGADKTVVEGKFSSENDPSIERFLTTNGYDTFPEHIIIRREITSKGQSRSFINDSPAPYSFVKSLGEKLVDFHGQHEHQSLFSVDEHLRLLDNVGNLQELRNDFSRGYDSFRTLLEDRKNLLHHEQILRNTIEFNTFQLNELENVNPRLNELEDLTKELQKAESSEKIVQSCEDIYSSIHDRNNSVRGGLLAIISQLESLSKFDSDFQSYYEECKTALVSVEETAQFVRNYKDNVRYDNERLEQLRERIVVLARLKKKYGTVENAIETMERLRKELGDTVDFEQRLNELEKEIVTQSLHLGKKAENLTVQRKRIAKDVAKQIVEYLKNVGIVDSSFEVVFNQMEKDFSYDECVVQCDRRYVLCNEKGIDRVEFFITTNKGESLKPLSKTASGGEVSRVMLALKSILAKSDRLPMLVFDEIDTGISGKVAQKVGKAMKELAHHHQIIAITHLPQVAAFADNHILVEKLTTKSRTKVSAHNLNESDRIHEVAKLLSGENVTEASLESARQLVYS